MASQFYDDYSLPSEFCSYPTPAVVTDCSPVLGGGAMWGTSTEENLVPIFCDNINGAASFDVVSPESDMSSCAMGAAAAAFPELLGFAEDAVAPVAFSEYSNLGLNGNEGFTHNFGAPGDSYIQQYNKGNSMFGDQDCCNGFMPADSKPLGLPLQENWGFNQGIQVPTMEDQATNMKVGRYSEEERKERIERYLKKRNQRNFNKTIKYACRKTLADRRVRVRGRFARNSSTEQLSGDDQNHQDMASEKIEDNCNVHANCNDRFDQMYCSGGTVQIKYDEEEWLQEAMASLVYLPYVTAG